MQAIRKFNFDNHTMFFEEIRLLKVNIELT